MHIADLKKDIKAGAEIFNSVPIKLQPCWASLILHEFDAYNSNIPAEVTELFAIVDNVDEWNSAYAQFNKIRGFLLKNKTYQPESYLLLAENVAKVTYNSNVGQAASFDFDSGYYIPSLAVTTAEYYNNKRLLDEVTNYFWLLSRFRKFKKEIQSVKDFKLFSHIDKILWQQWDPIGLVDYGCRDEYYSYVPEMFTLAKSDSSLGVLAEKLFYRSTDTIGVQDTLERNKEIAEKILKEAALVNSKNA